MSLDKNKRRKFKKKKYLKQRRSIERLYNRILSSTTTVDSTYSDTRNTNKRKNTGSSESPSAKRKTLNKNNDSVIVISDDTPKKPTPVLHTSTPNTARKEMSELDISGVVPNNNEEKSLTAQIHNLTREINRSSYVTIDLTTETLQGTNSSAMPTVIDLADTPGCEDTEGTVVIPDDSSPNRPEDSTLQDSHSDSDVTVIRNPRVQEAQENKMREFANGISRMNASEKGKLLEMITEKIFSGCQMQSRLKGCASNTVSNLFSFLHHFALEAF